MVEKTTLNKLIKKMNEISATDYDCENPFNKRNTRFAAAICRFINAELKAYNSENYNCEYQIVNKTTGYGDFSCFVKDLKHSDSICVYIHVNFASCGRLLHDCGFNSILYRIAENDHDWTGRSNNYSNIKDLVSDAISLYTKVSPVDNFIEEGGEVNMANLVLEDWTIEEETGYKPISTLYLDFSVADNSGITAIKNTYRRVFKEWKDNYKMLTELVMVLNWKMWRWVADNPEYEKVYEDLWGEADLYATSHLKDEELSYFYRVTD